MKIAPLSLAKKVVEALFSNAIECPFLHVPRGGGGQDFFSRAPTHLSLALTDEKTFHC